MNVLIDRTTLKVSGFNRLPSLNELVIEDVDVSQLPTKTIEYTVMEDKVDAVGLPLYLYPRKDKQIVGTVTNTVETTEVTDMPILIKKTRQVPLLDSDGNQVKYYPTYTRIAREEVIDEETGDVTVIENEIVETSDVPVFCFTTEDYEEAKTDSEGNPLYLTDVESETITYESQQPLEINEQHGWWNDTLEKIQVEVLKTKEVTIESDPQEFSFDEIKTLKDKQVAEEATNRLVNRENVDNLGMGVSMVMMDTDNLGHTIVDLLTQIDQLKADMEALKNA